MKQQTLIYLMAATAFVATLVVVNLSGVEFNENYLKVAIIFLSLVTIYRSRKMRDWWLAWVLLLFWLFVVWRY